jgi:hypothetical protein
MVRMSKFARTIYEEKYAMDLVEEDGSERKEDWPDTARRVTEHVLGALPDR